MPLPIAVPLMSDTGPFGHLRGDRISRSKNDSHDQVGDLRCARERHDGECGRAANSNDGPQLTAVHGLRLLRPRASRPPRHDGQMSLSAIAHRDDLTVRTSPEFGGVAISRGKDHCDGCCRLDSPLRSRRTSTIRTITRSPKRKQARAPAPRRMRSSVGTTAGDQRQPREAALLWFSSTLQQAGTALHTDQGAASSATFDPRDRSVLVIDDHGTAVTWPTSLAAWEQRACAIAGRNLTRPEWNQFLPGHEYATVCP